MLYEVLWLLILTLLTPNDPYSGRTAPLTSKRCILYKVVQIWPGLVFFFFVTIIDKQLLAHISLQRTPLTRAGERVEVVASLSRSHSYCAVRLVYTQISPGHI